MGGDKARTQAAAEAPTPEPKKDKKTRGGYYGAGEVTGSMLDTSQSRRGAFLGQ